MTGISLITRGMITGKHVYILRHPLTIDMNNKKPSINISRTNKIISVNKPVNPSINMSAKKISINIEEVKKTITLNVRRNL